MAKTDPPVPLPPPVYDAWLREDPKEVLGGPPEVKVREDRPDFLTFPAHRFTSEVLPEHYRKKLIIYGKSSEFKGLEITATVQGYDYLLMGHIRHNGEFQAADGKMYPDGHAHYHELDYYAPKAGLPGTRRIVQPPLAKGMRGEDFLECFGEHYRFTPLTEDIKAETPPPPTPPKKVQVDIFTSVARAQQQKGGE